ncbi:MAG: hypothetical protein ACE5LC_02945 [Candidatus Aminicenantales bacterium]
MSTILQTGITLWFNTEGKKKKEYGINFLKKKVTPEVYIAYLEKTRGLLSEGNESSEDEKSSSGFGGRTGKTCGHFRSI